MFNNSKKAEEAVNARNHIGQGTHIEGSIESSGGLRIDGSLKGEIEATGKLVIGEKGQVKGKITCKDAEIEGQISGSINSSGLLYFKSTAQVEGEIYAHQVKTDPGAVINGTIDMQSARQQTPSVNGKAKKQAAKEAAATV